MSILALSKEDLLSFVESSVHLSNAIEEITNRIYNNDQPILDYTKVRPNSIDDEFLTGTDKVREAVKRLMLLQKSS